MLNCTKCKRTTKKSEPTGLIMEYKFWEDNNGKHKDIVKSKKACMQCVKLGQDVSSEDSE